MPRTAARALTVDRDQLLEFIRPRHHGILVTTQDRLNEQVAEAHAARWQVGVHANGDVAIDMVLKAYELALRQYPRKDPRHRLEHCTLVNPALLVVFRIIEGTL